MPHLASMPEKKQGLVKSRRKIMKYDYKIFHHDNYDEYFLLYKNIHYNYIDIDKNNIILSHYGTKKCLRKILKHFNLNYKLV